MRFWGIVTLACLAGSVFAQMKVLDAKTIPPPTIDGNVTEAEWAGASMGEGSFDETNGQAASEPMKFWLGQDDKYLYFAAKLGDSQPGSIQATEYRTNAGLTSDDYVQLDLDLSGSLADFNEFRINPRGATDTQLAGGRAVKREWSGEFVAKGRITAEGWELEARIPWQILVLPHKGPHDIRFNVTRHLQRLTRDYVFFYDPGGHRQDTPTWKAVNIPSQKDERTLKLLPYGYGGYDADTHGIANAGLDMKTMLTDSIHLVGTINPDFRNIENGILSLDFSRFERLAGESRPFFQEGSQYLGSALFASQRIRGFDVGLNNYGKLSDKISYGMLDTIDFGNENDFVSNFTYDPTPDDSYRLGVTSLKRPGLANDSYLLRYSKQVGPMNIFLRNMGSRDTRRDSGDNSIAQLNYQKQGFTGTFDYQRVSPNFLPRLGFFPERDFKGFDFDFGYERPFEHGTWANLGAEVFGLTYDRIGGAQYRDMAGFNTMAQLRSGLLANFGGQFENFEGVKDRLFTSSLLFPRGNAYRHIRLQVDSGVLQELPYTSIAGEIAYRPIQALQLSLSHQSVNYDGHNHQTIFGFNYDLGNDQSITARAVRQQRDTNAYLAYRRSGNRGAEYYVILGDPNSQKFRTALVVKAVFPFEIPLGKA